MVALWNRADRLYFHAIVCSSSFFFPRLISTAADLMSAILPHKLVKQQYVLHMSPQYGELRPTSGCDQRPSRWALAHISSLLLFSGVQYMSFMGILDIVVRC